MHPFAATPGALYDSHRYPSQALRSHNLGNLTCFLPPPGIATIPPPQVPGLSRERCEIVSVGCSPDLVDQQLAASGEALVDQNPKAYEIGSRAIRRGPHEWLLRMTPSLYGNLLTIPRKQVRAVRKLRGNTSIVFEILPTHAAQALKYSYPTHEDGRIITRLNWAFNAVRVPDCPGYLHLSQGRTGSS
jgi:hypothetical protein